MKGSLHTDELMGAVVAREGGIRTERRISHCFIMDVPSHPDPLIITDAAVNIAPDLDAKVDIIQNAIDLAHAMGAPEVRVAILSAMETVTAKVPSTIEAAALCKMAERGQITGALLDGPLALDNAISPEAAAIKKIVVSRRRTRQRAGRSGPRGRQHARQEPLIPRRGGRRRNCARGPRADHSDEPRGLAPDPPRLLRRRGHGRGGATQVGGSVGAICSMSYCGANPFVPDDNVMGGVDDGANAVARPNRGRHVELHRRDQCRFLERQVRDLPGDEGGALPLPRASRGDRNGAAPEGGGRRRRWRRETIIRGAGLRPWRGYARDPRERARVARWRLVDRLRSSRGPRRPQVRESLCA